MLKMGTFVGAECLKIGRPEAFVSMFLVVLLMDPPPGHFISKKNVLLTKILSLHLA